MEEAEADAKPHRLLQQSTSMESDGVEETDTELAAALRRYVKACGVEGWKEESEGMGWDGIEWDGMG